MLVTLVMIEMLFFWWLSCQLEKEKADKMTKKDDKKKEAEELNVLFKPVEQKVAKGQNLIKSLIFIQIVAFT